MNILRAIKQSFSIVWKNLILAQPPILFLIVISILTAGMSGLRRVPVAGIIFFISFILLVAAFFAGWFFMAKKTIVFAMDDSMPEEEKAIKSFGLVKHFFPGVGEYFLPQVVLGILYVLFSFVVTYIAFQVGEKFLGAPNIDFAKLNEYSTSVTEFQSYINSLGTEQAYSLLSWLSYLFFVALCGQFVTIWWVPALFYKTKNPFMAIVEGTKFLFRKFGASVGIFLFLMIFHFVVSFVNSLTSQNIIIALIGFVLFFYFVTYYVVLIFLYYGQNGETSAKDYIDSGYNGNGQKLAGSESGEEN